MSTTPIDHGGLASSGTKLALAYADIKKPEEATRSGEYQRNNAGIRKPIGPIYRTPTVTPLL
jgi:hypothetical protein